MKEQVPEHFKKLGINPCAAGDQAAQGQILHSAYIGDPLATLTAQIDFHTPYGQTLFIQLNSSITLGRTVHGGI